MGLEQGPTQTTRNPRVGGWAGS